METIYNPKLYCRPKNVKIGKTFLYAPDNVIAHNLIPYGEEVTIVRKLAVRERGKAIVKVECEDGTTQNVFLEHLAVLFNKEKE